MSSLPAFPRASFLLLCILGTTLPTAGFPHPRLPIRSPDSSVESKHDWDVLFPAMSLHDSSMQMMSSPTANRNAAVLGKARPSATSQLSEGADMRLEQGWPAAAAGVMRRNMVVADDAAFREKSKLLATMERQKWLNSYMQKLLVVNSQ
ncbi:tuberoinfundibular peptide of 39 residues [Lampris incognitus]|uniref:tuberoinfundibular peptide of 39 residues n=1 Tax=Lampris incognitus TaxID=2546036 RepID=UPI0024B4BF52|nr:tuberoinfundibular peptide of 39 residues [Lampris incognitus]